MAKPESYAALPLMSSAALLSSLLLSSAFLTVALGAEFNETDVWLDQEITDMYPLVAVVNELEDAEKDQLDDFLERREYASIKSFIDRKLEAQKRDEGNLEIAAIANDSSNPTYQLIRQLSEDDYNLVNAYVNACVYETLSELWTNVIASDLPSIDQHAILDYFHERHIRDLEEQTFFTRLWSLIRRLFMAHDDDDVSPLDKSECDATNPQCVRLILESLTPEEKSELKELITNSNNGTVVFLFLRQRRGDRIPNEVVEEYEHWVEGNQVPVPLRDIVDRASEAEKRALAKLRDRKLVNSIKDYYRDMIEKRSYDEQQAIKRFFKRMNDTWASCYKPVEVND
ncbi:hypothetical protein QR680_013554 [Steinernema hermaphroditum]|uniref:Uncharacterized protein n=1 Tax=Steinernema hermaphroditum TaxID=289476 RepID=A0AA39I8Q4_9BILA|nr:hypothetical protein QR680_013554 [Steinernema hermaphroditum]